jgi:transcriptional regulator with XRE-family HTH domain
VVEEPIGSPTVFMRLVAIELVQMREKTDPVLSRADMAKELGCSPQKISLLETSARRPTYKDLQAWTAACDRADRLEVLWMRTTLGRDHGWWENSRNRDLSGPESFGTYVGLEQGASRILLWDPLTVSGLLQTRATAESLITAYEPDLPQDEVAERAELRIRRQDVLTRVNPVELQSIFSNI